MKYLPMIWMGLWYRPRRTVFTVLSIIVAFILFGSLQGLNAGFDKSVSDQNLDMLISDSRVPGGPQMPVAALARIEKLPGVVSATQRATFFGWYQQPKNTIAVIAADPSKFFALRPGLVGSPQDLQALRTFRTGMIATPAMQRHLRWKVGDKIPFKSSMLRRNGSADWTFDLVGTFDVAGKPNEAFLAIINYDYFDAERVEGRGTAERFLIKIADPNRSAQTAAAIDQMFANSPYETRTRSEKEMAQSRLKQIGDVKFITNAIIGAVLFTLLFVTGNTMRQAVHERTSEFGVMKAVGFSGATILVLVLLEALILCLLAAVIGLALARGMTPLLAGIIGTVDFSWSVVARGLLIAIALAAISAMLPAWRVWRLRVVDALAGR